MQTKCHLNLSPLNLTTGFILATPGRKEYEAGRPAAGQTGRNLDGVLAALTERRPDLFPSAQRYDYTITNAATLVLYEGKDGRTTPTTAEVNEADNVARLLDETKDLQLIIALGGDAAKAARHIREARTHGSLPLTVIQSRHMSMQGLNRTIREDITGRAIIRGEPDATRRRLAVVADEILKAIDDALAPA